jgi:hypothetical protein
VTSSQKRKLVAYTTLAAVVLLAIGALIANVLSSGKSSPRVAGTAEPGGTTTSLQQVPVIPIPRLTRFGNTGDDLERRVRAGRDATYHAVYSITDARLDPNVAESLEVWRKGPKVRTDVIDKSPTGEHRSRAIVSGANSTACNTVNGVEHCSTSSTGPIDLPEKFVSAIIAMKPQGKVTVRDINVAGVDGRCYAMTGVGELCLRVDGALLSSEQGGTRTDVVSLENVVADDAFKTEKAVPSTTTSS